MNGSPSDDDVVEALLAEALVTLQARHPDLELPDAATDASARSEAWRAQVAAWRREAELAAEARIPGHAEDDRDDVLARAIAEALAATAVGPPPDDPHALDAHLRDLAAQLAGRDLALGRAALALWDSDGWHHRGYASPHQYARERVGSSLAALEARMALARRCVGLPRVAAALDAGELGFEAAALVARVAQRSTVGSAGGA